ncbi:MAG TPA: M48 family metallopeptidase [Anaerolineae bacterium]|nr:M48 family metallopeptidase [Anaerolineae bacterium]
MSEARLDPQRQSKAKEYARIHRRLFLVDVTIGGVYALAWLGLGWSASLKATLLTVTTDHWLLVALFGAVFGGLYYLLNLPLSYYSGFVLPQRFELSTQTRTGWIGDQVKALGISALLGGVVLEAVYALLRAAPDTWWLWAGALSLLFSVVLTNLAPVLIAPLFYKFVPLGEEHAELAQRLIRLAERAGARVRGVFKFDMSRRTRTANAALMGIGNTRRIVLGDTLIDSFTPDEIETILAHELGHHVNKDIPIGILVSTGLTLGGLYLASLALKWGAAAYGLAGPADIAALPVFALVMGAYSLITLPLSNAYSRWRERRADAYAVRATGKGEAFAAALARLGNQNLSDADPEPWVEFLFYSHPPLGKRIAVANATAKSTQPCAKN